MASTAPGGATQSHTGGREPKKVKLRLTVEEVDRQNGKVTRFTSKQESGEPCDDGKGNLDFKDKEKWDGPVRIEIRIKNDSGCTMAFGTDPLWVMAGPGCPQEPTYEPDEFEVLPCGGALDLIVLDYNRTSGAYGYTLVLESTDSATGRFLLDPIVTNGGGGLISA